MLDNNQSHKYRASGFLRTYLSWISPLNQKMAVMPHVFCFYNIHDLSTRNWKLTVSHLVNCECYWPFGIVLLHEYARY